MDEQEFQENPAGAYVRGVTRKINEYHNERDAQARARRERNQQLGWAGRLKETFFGRRDDDGSSATPAVRPGPEPKSPPRFVQVEAFEDDAMDDGTMLTPEQRLKQRRMERIEGGAGRSPTA